MNPRGHFQAQVYFCQNTGSLETLRSCQRVFPEDQPEQGLSWGRGRRGRGRRATLTCFTKAGLAGTLSHSGDRMEGCREPAELLAPWAVASHPPREGVARRVQRHPRHRMPGHQLWATLPSRGPSLGPSHTCDPPEACCFWPSHLPLCCPAWNFLPLPHPPPPPPSLRFTGCWDSAQAAPPGSLPDPGPPPHGSATLPASSSPLCHGLHPPVHSSARDRQPSFMAG